MKEIDLNSWHRKEYFQFFSSYDEPFFGIVSEVDVTKVYKMCKEHKTSFFAWYLHKSIMAINQIPELKTRLVDGKIIEYDEIHASATIGRNDGTFGFSYIPYNLNFDLFYEKLNSEIERIKNTTGLAFTSDEARHNVIHYSSVPWIKITGLTHARNLKITDSIPKISFGKATFAENKMMMSVAFNAHHGFVDGLHAGHFFEVFQQLLNE